MLSEILGKKVGMTQIFDGQKNVVSATVIDIGGWIVTQIKNKEIDGYSALQFGRPRKRYIGGAFEDSWLKNKKKFFEHIKEINVSENMTANFKLGQEIKVSDLALNEKTVVKVSGTSRGLGFQGVVKRYNFSGGPSAHGSNFHRIPGSIGNMCSQGNVVKGKKLPGRCGFKKVTLKNLRVVKVDPENSCMFISGSVPGKKDALLSICKAG